MVSKEKSEAIFTLKAESPDGGEATFSLPNQERQLSTTLPVFQEPGCSLTLVLNIRTMDKGIIFKCMWKAHKAKT